MYILFSLFSALSFLCTIFDSSLSVYLHGNTKITIPQLKEERENLFWILEPKYANIQFYFLKSWEYLFCIFPFPLHLPGVKSFFSVVSTVVIFFQECFRPR